MPSPRPRIVRKAEDLHASRAGTLVPTMGALHDGHASLIRAAAAYPEPTIVSIFVNPSQFGPNEDFERYPRDLERDLDIAGAAGADLAFVPDNDEVYPPNLSIPTPPLPDVATTPRLEDHARPEHFEGVCQVVSRLFDLVQPRRALFGEKDYQQLQVIRAMVSAEQSERGRWDHLEIIAAPTVRDGDGLALSSRNQYLEPHERDRALGLFRALRSAHAAQHPATAESMMRAELDAHELVVDYAVVRDASTLLPVSTFEQPTRGLIAARLGPIRLIDNMAMTVWR